MLIFVSSGVDIQNYQDHIPHDEIVRMKMNISDALAAATASTRAVNTAMQSSVNTSVGSNKVKRRLGLRGTQSSTGE
jgi:hypothetical protein